MIWLSSRLRLCAVEDMPAAGRSACVLTVRPHYISIHTFIYMCVWNTCACMDLCAKRLWGKSFLAIFILLA